jgi:hypothetical protein
MSVPQAQSEPHSRIDVTAPIAAANIAAAIAAAIAAGVRAAVLVARLIGALVASRGLGLRGGSRRIIEFLREACDED